MPASSITTRFAISIFGNVLRGALSFVTTIIIARTLGPEEYGNYAFLLGSFAAILHLVGLGTSGAFQTFISEKTQGKKFILSYLLWQFTQFLFVLLIIGVVLPENWVIKIWLNQERDLVLLAFAAIFLQQQAWRTFIHIGEASRLSYKVQALNLAIVCVHFLLVIVSLVMQWLSVQLIFYFILVEYLIFMFVAHRVQLISFSEEKSFDGRSVLSDYMQYCYPLIIGAILSFGYLFADRWMLQSFGGAKEQGLYEIGYRMGAAAMLVTAALLNIFYKEIAEAKENRNWQLMQILYRKVSRLLFTISAIIAGFLIPWSPKIIQLILGKSYDQGAPVLVTMLCFSVFNSVAQVNSSMLLATSKTKAHLVLGSVLMIANFPIAYFLLAPKNMVIPGVEMGSLGLALKMVLHIVFHVNLLSWWIARDNKWKFDWFYQLVALGGAIALGFISFESSMFLSGFLSLNLFVVGILALFLYVALSGIMLFSMPWLIGFSREEINSKFQIIKLSWAQR